MATEKLNVSLCVVKKEGTSQAGKPYKIFEVTTEKGKFDSFDEMSIGEHEVEIQPDTSGKGYNGKIKLVKPANANGFKGGGFGAKKEDADKRCALECAVRIGTLQNPDDVIKAADKFLNWLK